MIERAVELVDGVRPECVAHLGPVECHPHRRLRFGIAVDMAVVGDICQVSETVGCLGDGPPLAGVKRILAHGVTPYRTPNTAVDGPLNGDAVLPEGTQQAVGPFAGGQRIHQ